MRSLDGIVTLNPGTYCGWTFSGNPINDVTLNPGIYYMRGPIHANNGGTKVQFHGSGVMIYLAPGMSPAASIDLGATNDVHINLSAPTSGPYTGVVFYQDRANAAPAMFAKNNGDFTLSGASYFPNSSVTIKNNLAWSGDCTLFVAKDLTTKNNANVNNHCDAFPGSPLLTVSLAE